MLGWGSGFREQQASNFSALGLEARKLEHHYLKVTHREA